MTFPDYIPSFNTKAKFFPLTLIEWNDLAINKRNSESYATFNKRIWRFIRPYENPIFNCHNPSWIKLITRLRLGFRHLREHKFRHNFWDTLNPSCKCGENIESTTHDLLHRSKYLNETMTLLTNLQNVEENILYRTYSQFSEELLFGDSSFNDTNIKSILNSTIQYRFDTQRFDVPLINL